MFNLKIVKIKSQNIISMIKFLILVGNSPFSRVWFLWDVLYSYRNTNLYAGRSRQLAKLNPREFITDSFEF